MLRNYVPPQNVVVCQKLNVPMRRKTRCSSSLTVEPGNMGRPVDNSYKMHPTPLNARHITQTLCLIAKTTTKTKTLKLKQMNTSLTFECSRDNSCERMDLSRFSASAFFFPVREIQSVDGSRGPRFWFLVIWMAALGCLWAGDIGRRHAAAVTHGLIRLLG